jgi:hypothetical protein
MPKKIQVAHAPVTTYERIHKNETNQEDCKNLYFVLPSDDRLEDEMKPFIKLMTEHTIEKININSIHLQFINDSRLKNLAMMTITKDSYKYLNKIKQCTVKIKDNSRQEILFNKKIQFIDPLLGTSYNSKSLILKFNDAHSFKQFRKVMCEWLESITIEFNQLDNLEMTFFLEKALDETDFEYMTDTIIVLNPDPNDLIQLGFREVTNTYDNPLFDGVGGKNTSSPYKKTEMRKRIQGRQRVIYTDARRRQYIRLKGAFVPIKSLS